MDGMYTISEMASIFGVSRQTLIYYDKIGLFAPAEVNGEGLSFLLAYADSSHAPDLHVA